MRPFPARILSLFFAALSAACSDSAAPEAALLSAENAPVLRSIWVDGPNDLPLEPGEQLPDAFSSAPLIASTHIDVGFEPNKAWATTSVRYFATHLRLSLRLKVKRGTTVVDTDSAVAVDENLLPGFNTVSTRVNISTASECGHHADANSSASVWMSFPIPRAGDLFSWGKITIPNTRTYSQPECRSGTFSPSTNDWLDEEFGEGFFDEDNGAGNVPDAPTDGYEGDCFLCQRWYAIYDSEIIAAWWECNEVDDSYCEYVM